MARRPKNYIRLLQVAPAVLLIAGALFPLVLFSLKKGSDDSFQSHNLHKKIDTHSPIFFPPLTPWESIGGCGAGGSGGVNGGDGIKWMGVGVSGGLLDVEVLPKYHIEKDFNSFSIAPRFSFKPTWTTTAGITIPVSLKTGEVQYLSNQSSQDRTTGGLGDISIDVSKKIGMSGEYSLSLSMSLPTGQYDIKRGSDRDATILPARLQNGTGLYNAALEINRTIDVEKGFLLIDAIYNYPFNMKPFSKKNEMLDKYYSSYKDQTGNPRFYYRGKPYGENDLGAYTPPSISFASYYAYKGIENYVHSWGMTFSAPLGVAWINSEKPGLYDPKPDPDHAAWNAAFIYGIEFTKPKFPLFMAVSLPIHDRTNSPGTDIYDPKPMGKWDWPDWNDFLNRWTFALGFKTTMF